MQLWAGFSCGCRERLPVGRVVLLPPDSGGGDVIWWVVLDVTDRTSCPEGGLPFPNTYFPEGHAEHSIFHRYAKYPSAAPSDWWGICRPNCFGIRFGQNKNSLNKKKQIKDAPFLGTFYLKVKWQSINPTENRHACATRRKSPLICKRCFVITRKSVSALKTQSRMTRGRTINCKDVALRDQRWNVLGFNVFKYALKVKNMMKKKKRQFFISFLWL